MVKSELNKEIQQRLNFLRSISDRNKIVNDEIERIEKILSSLEIIDNNLSKDYQASDSYYSSYGPIGSRKVKNFEYNKLKNQYNTAPDNEKFNIFKKMIRTAMGMEDWGKIIDIVEIIKKEPFWEELTIIEKQPIFRDFGIAITKLYDKPYRMYEKGRDHLYKATKLNKSDSDAFSSYAGTWKNIDDKKAIKYYKKALKSDKANPYPLVNLIIYNLRKKNKLKLSNKTRNKIHGAIQTRMNHIKVLKDIPWAFYDIGTLSLLLNKEEDCFAYYSLALCFSPEAWMIKTTLNTLNLIEHVLNRIPYFKKIKLLFLLAIAFLLKKKINFDQESYSEIIEEINKYNLKFMERNLKKNIVIIAGGLNDLNITEYENNFKGVFKEFIGSIICGSPRNGIGDFVSTLYLLSQNIDAYVYLPGDISTGAIKNQVSFIHKIDDYRFDHFETFQYWYDILSSNIDPSTVKLIGINGNKYSSLEYCIAIALGAQVCMIKNDAVSVNNLINFHGIKEIITNEMNDKTYRVYKTIVNRSDLISDFLKSKLIRDFDNENIRQLIIQDDVGKAIYIKNFSITQDKGDLFSGLFIGLSDFGKELYGQDLKTLEYKGIYVTAYRFQNERILANFFLYKKPSQFLERNIESFMKICEELFMDEFMEFYETGAVPDIESQMNQLLSKIFGSELIN